VEGDRGEVQMSERSWSELAAGTARYCATLHGNLTDRHAGTLGANNYEGDIYYSSSMLQFYAPAVNRASSPLLTSACLPICCENTDTIL
jgi:hypothetical protein